MPRPHAPLAEPGVRTTPALKRPPLYRVVLHNDDYTTQEFVVYVLRTIFRKPEAEATRIMLAVHRSGKGIAGVYPYDVACTKQEQARVLAEGQGFPLLCTVEPED